MNKFFVFAIFLLIFFSCKHQQNTVLQEDVNKPLVLVSKDYGNIHQDWLRASIGNDKVICFNMYAVKSSDSVRMMLHKADGIIISGGEDVNPALYGKENELNRCGSINSHRDSLEQMMIRYAVNRKIPLLGICRGLQILNVTQGGSLIIDIPADVGSKYLHRDSRKAKKNKSTAVNHTVYINRGTYLYNIVKADSSIVYSNHHQAMEKVAPFFKVSSFAKDKVSESFEPADTLLHPFILGVQWHPEAMKTKNPLSGTIGKKFMTKVSQHFMID
ncbi:MAG: gamma-glutamyl-gamma-aminobutyrate hydrolase family protein [Bacteroidales bacterium]|nr:gamma-glutamyl-gamma-aminobutyrate hydrolase family protein [Bacteroidales bacterium]